ncbi:hypothetical protein ABIA33_003047 [Streptacidiphilus sp. MAP12-16]
MKGVAPAGELDQAAGAHSLRRVIRPGLSGDVRKDPDGGTGILPHRAAGTTGAKVRRSATSIALPVHGG